MADCITVLIQSLQAKEINEKVFGKHLTGTRHFNENDYKRTLQYKVK